MKPKPQSQSVKIRIPIYLEIKEFSLKTGIPQSRLVEQGWELRKKKLTNN